MVGGRLWSNQRLEQHMTSWGNSQMERELAAWGLAKPSARPEMLLCLLKEWWRAGWGWGSVTPSGADPI